LLVYNSAEPGISQNPNRTRTCVYKLNKNPNRTEPIQRGFYPMSTRGARAVLTKMHCTPMFTGACPQCTIPRK